MNAKQAKAIPIRTVMAALGHEPAGNPKPNGDVWYLSPFRNERDPSFKTNEKINCWYDFGERRGGTVIDLAMSAKNVDAKSALAWLSGLGAAPTAERRTPEAPAKRLPWAGTTRVSKIAHPGLVGYLEARGISAQTARRHCSEVHYQPAAGKRYFSIGLPTVNGGYSCRNRYSKNFVGPAGPSLIKGETGGATFFFEGMFDALSMAEAVGDRMPRCVVLNSTSNLVQGLGLCGKGDKAVYLFNRDPNGTGQRASRVAVGTIPGFDMSGHYGPYNDLNDWLRADKAGFTDFARRLLFSFSTARA